MRVLGLSVIAFHGATAAVRGGIPGDPPHEPLAGEISVAAAAAAAAASKRRGPGNQRFAAADPSKTLPTVGRQAKIGINLEGDKAREKEVERQRNPVAVRRLPAEARTGPDPGEVRTGHHLTLEQTLRVETNTRGDGRQGSATPPPPPPPPPPPLPQAVWRHDDDAEEASGGGDGGLPFDENDSSVDVRVGPAGDGNGANARVDGGDGGSISRDGGEEDGDGGGGGGPSERCYSSPAADPSQGAWKECPGGEEECSPTRTTRGYWAGKWGTDFNHCSALWAARHPERGSRPYWRWEPTFCRLEEVTADGFCGAMEGRKGLLLVGDSLTRHFTLTLAAALGARHVSTSKFASDLFLACGDSLRVMHYRNDLLDTRVEEFPTAHCVEPDHGSTRCTLFADDATLEEFDTLVVNSGAHILRGGMAAYTEMMSQASTALTASMRRLHGDGAILVVRNTSPGHWNCGEIMFNGPVDTDTAANLTAQAPQLYEWETFGEKNEVLQEAFSAEDGWRLLDAYTPTVLRADGHYAMGKDCLHYCLPGPIDHWLTLLYNILLEASDVR